MTTKTDDRARAIARTALKQIGNPTLHALKPSLMTIDPADNGDVTLRFAVGSTTGKFIRKVAVRYIAGRDTYVVTGHRFGLTWSPQGTALTDDLRYEADDVYCDQLATVVVAAAKAAGARPRGL